MAAGPQPLATEEWIEIADESPEALLALCAARGWGDGLPVIAPTAERVVAMLGGRDPERIVGSIAPRFGAASLRSLAVNAVLAGCPAEVFPVLIAAVTAMCEPRFNLQGMQSTTHAVAPLVIVHGEAALRLGFNAGCGAFGPGPRANATLGRAVRFVLMHIGGGRPGAGDQSTQGQPSKYSYCVAENTEQSPWESYPHSLGMAARSAVTVAGCEGPHNVHDMESSRADRILLKAASAIASLGSNNACISEGEIFVALCPEHAATIAADGWTRRDVQSFLYERARLPRCSFLDAFERRRWRAWMHADGADDLLLPMTDHPDNYRVLVVGGAGKHSSVIPGWGVTQSVTVAIEEE